MAPTEKAYNKGLMKEIKEKQRKMKEEQLNNPDPADSINDRA